MRTESRRTRRWAAVGFVAPVVLISYLLGGCAGSSGTTSARRVPANGVPANLVAAEELVNALDAVDPPNPDNRYTTPSRVVWGTPGQPETYVAYSECASFVTAVLEHSYPDWATSQFFLTTFGAI